MRDPSEYKPNSNYVLVRKCVRYDDLGDGNRGIKVEGTEGIAVPDRVFDFTNFCEVIAVGPKCVMVTENNIGDTVRVPESSHELHCIDYEHGEYWMVRECELKKKNKRSQKLVSNVQKPVIEPVIWG